MKRINFKKSFFLFLLVLPFGLSATPKLTYKLFMLEPHTHYFEVEIEVSGINQLYLDFKMPVWAPGSYLVREFSRHIEGVNATVNGSKAKAEQMNKNTWRVNTSKAKKMVFSYRVYAFELSVRTSFIDASHAYINGTSVFMYIDGYKDLPSTLSITPFADWKKISTSLKPKKSNQWDFYLPNYDILADSPIEIGNHEVFEFKASGVLHKVAMYGEEGNYEVEKLKTDMKKVVEACTNVFGENPNKEYLFIIHNLTNGGGGLEHLNSTTLQVNRWTYEGAAYKGFLSLVAHEYFHLWNAKRIRPKALGPFNYDAENYTRLLWVMEGFTSYYDELLLLRAGVYDKNELINRLMGQINYIENLPGNHVESVASSSFNAWIKAYRPHENSSNTSISYYPKGSMVALMLDLQIMHSSKGQKSLDDLMRYLYAEFYKKENRGFTDEEFQEAFTKVSGTDLTKFFEGNVYGVKTIDFQQFFNYAGFDFIQTPKNTGKAYLGVKTSGNDRVKITETARDGSAYVAGLNVNDEIIAIDDIRVNTSRLEQIISMKIPSDVIKVLVARDELLEEIEVKLLKDPRFTYSLEQQKNTNEEQNQVMKKWLMN